MEISLEQIYDFTVCPMLYKFKHEMKIVRTGFSIDKEYQDALHKAAMFFYYQALNGKEPTVEVLRQKFGSILYKNMSVQDILAGSMIDKNLNAVNLSGIKVLTHFHERESKKEFVPIMVDTDVRIAVGDHFITFTMDLVREVKESGHSILEVTKFTATNSKIDTFYVNHNISLTAHSYAFRKLFDSTENRLVLQHIKQCKEYYTIRREAEFKRFEALVNSIAGIIERQELYPVHNAKCNQCLYRDVCDKYRF